MKRKRVKVGRFIKCLKLSSITELRIGVWDTEEEYGFSSQTYFDKCEITSIEDIEACAVRLSSDINTANLLLSEDEVDIFCTEESEIHAEFVVTWLENPFAMVIVTLNYTSDMTEFE